MQPLEEDGSNSIFVLHSPLNAKFVFEVNALTIVRTNDAPLCGRSFITTHHLVYVWIHWTHVCVFVPFFFFFTRFGVTRLLFMYCSLNSNRKCWLFRSKQCISVLFTVYCGKVNICSYCSCTVHWTVTANVDFSAVNSASVYYS